MKKTSIVYFLLSLFLLENAQAGEAHVHGLATLTLAMESQSLEIEFESPAANLVGFEHKAKSPKEKKAVKSAEAILQKAADLFVFSSASCQLKEMEVDTSGLMEDSHSDHGYHHNDHHSSNYENEDDGHSGIKALYRFTCNGAKQPESVYTKLFVLFSDIEAINATWVSDTSQGSKLLKPNSAQFLLR